MLFGVLRKVLLGLAIVSLARSAAGFESRFYSIEAQVQVQRSPAALIVSWPKRDDARNYTVRRKLAGQQSWSGPIANLPGDASGFTDSNVAIGTAYEYEILMESVFEAPGGGWVTAHTYLWAGIDVPERHTRGRVILVVDSAVAAGIANELGTFEQNLRGAGWSVVRRDVPRAATPVEVRNLIRGEYNADRANTRSVILIGHVPVPYSGNIAPDMHDGHRGAWPADAFYGEMDGNWTDDTVSARGVDFSENDNVPRDGKLDQSLLPSPVELEVGRIDFWQLPSFSGRSEVDLLRNYFRKNHAFRHRQFTAPRQGLIRDNFGDFEGDAPAVDAWRHYNGFFGADRVREVGPGEFFNALSSDGYLWAYGCGGGANDKADGVGTTADFAASDPRAVFLMLHGSYFGDFNYPDNFLRAAIATPTYTLASVWTGLPHWYMHHMALGETIGYSTRVTQNNLSLYKSYRNFSPGEVHISLIGDPTLEMFPVRPPANLSGTTGGDVQLRWDASGDDNIRGYHVYHASTANGPYTRITQQPITATALNHSIGVGVHYYMVRAVKLEQTGSGTYFNLSQGIFASVQKSSGGISTPTVSIDVYDGEATEFRSNPGSFRFTRDTVDGNALTVSFTIGGSAENGGDYGPITDTITIPAWEASTLLTFYPKPDSAAEGDETVVLQLKQGTSYQVGGQASASISIRDYVAVVNERPTISSIADQVISAGATRDVTFTVADSQTPAGALTVRGSSDNQGVVPDGGLQFGGTGGNRNLRIVAAIGASGSARVTVTVTDGLLESSVAFTVTIPANQPPVGQSVQVTTAQDMAQPVVLTGSDPEGANLQFRVVTQPTRGTLTGTPPLLVYRPLPNVSGTDSFTFVVNDGARDSAPATVTITITPSADLRITTVRPSGASILLRFSGPAGKAVRVEGSTDTEVWISEGTVTLGANGTGDFLAPQSSGAKVKIYRLEVE